MKTGIESNNNPRPMAKTNKYTSALFILVDVNK